MSATATGPAVGFVGLGIMGLPMSLNLARAGFPVLVWNRSGPALDIAAAAGAGVATDPADVGRRTEVVLTMLPDLPHVEEILDGPEGLLATGSTVTTIVIMGTVSPTRVALLGERLCGHGIELIDAPVSGGLPGARDAKLSIMAGATPDGFTRIRPYLAAMGATVRHLGPVGAGSLAKACNQLVVAATLAALAEAVLLAERAGLETAELLAVLGGGLASSEVLRQKRHHLLGGDFTGSGQASYLVKDLDFALESAQVTGVELSVTAAARTLYHAVVELGMGHLDNSAVLAALRQQVGRSA